MNLRTLATIILDEPFPSSRLTSLMLLAPRNSLEFRDDPTSQEVFYIAVHKMMVSQA